MISISTTHLASMRAHAEADYPHECCGGLLGTFDGEIKTVTDVIALDNHWDDIPGEDKTRRFRITPEDYKMLEKKAASDGVMLLGFTTPIPIIRPFQVTPILICVALFFLPHIGG